MNAWLAANWRWVFGAVVWLALCAGAFAFFASSRRPCERRARVRELARDDTH